MVYLHSAEQRKESSQLILKQNMMSPNKEHSAGGAKTLPQ